MTAQRSDATNRLIEAAGLPCYRVVNDGVGAMNRHRECGAHAVQSARLCEGLKSAAVRLHSDFESQATCMCDQLREVLANRHLSACQHNRATAARLRLVDECEYLFCTRIEALSIALAISAGRLDHTVDATVVAAVSDLDVSEHGPLRLAVRH